MLRNLADGSHRALISSSPASSFSAPCSPHPPKAPGAVPVEEESAELPETGSNGRTDAEPDAEERVPTSCLGPCVTLYVTVRVQPGADSVCPIRSGPTIPDDRKRSLP